VVGRIEIAGRIHCFRPRLTEFAALRRGPLHGMRGYEQARRPALVGAYE
jgi:hypothetical protein